MRRLYIYCEGPTEESFINTTLYPYLQNAGVAAIPIVCETKRTAAKKYKGGVSDYNKIKKELTAICKQHSNEIVTTMFDYYGLPENTPGYATASGNIYAKAQHIEAAVEADLGSMRNLFFNLTVHEFEGLLFTDTSAFSYITDGTAVAKLQEIKDSFDSPEHINNSSETAPSKRIEEIIPGYSKVLDGTKLAERIGIDNISAQCQHFGKWISRAIVQASP